VKEQAAHGGLRQDVLFGRFVGLSMRLEVSGEAKLASQAGPDGGAREEEKRRRGEEEERRRVWQHSLRTQLQLGTRAHGDPDRITGTSTRIHTHPSTTCAP